MDYILDRLTSEKRSNLPVIISIITGFPSFALYALEAVVIARNWRKFDSPFWRLFFIRACIHIIDFLNSIIFNRIGQIPLVDYSTYAKIPSVVLGIGSFLWLYVYESQNFISIFLVLTRLTSIRFPMKHRKIWRWLMPLCLFITFIIPLFDTWEELIRKNRIEYDDSNVRFDNTTYQIYYDSEYYENNYKVLGYESSYKLLNALYTSSDLAFTRSNVILLVASTSLNIITIYLYSRKQGNTTMSEEERNVEKRLLIFTVLNFLCQMLLVLWWIITTVCYGKLYICRLLSNQYYWIKDIDSVHSPAWLILWSSKMLRELVYKQIGIGKYWQKENERQITTQTLPKNAWK